MRRFLDLPTGYGAISLALIGGKRLVPPVGYMGGKRRLAPDILRILGVRGPPTELVLADAGCPGWVWPEMLTVERAAAVAKVLRSWSSRGPVELWEELVAIPPFDDPAARAAQVLWLQGRMATCCPLIWEGARWEMGDKPRASGHLSRLVAQLGGHVVERAQEVAFQRKRAKGKGFGLRTAGGLLGSESVALRVESIAAALVRLPVRFHAGDLETAIPAGDLSGDVAYFDPDYQGCTSYGATVERARMLALGQDVRRRGARVGISEAVPLPLNGWHHVDMTREGGKPEWLTCSHRPALVPARQAPLFDAGRTESA